MINTYRRASLFGHAIQVSNAPLREYVDIRMVPYLEKNIMNFRIWHNECIHSHFHWRIFESIFKVNESLLFNYS
jgi:hypothetical protein